MLRNKLLFFVFIIFIFNANAQIWKRYRYEAIVGIGGTNFLGELGGANQIGTHYMKDFRLSMTRPLVDAAFRYQINPHLSIKSILSVGILRGDDNTTKDIYRNYRNLSFRSPIVELSCQAEYWPIREKIKVNRYTLRRKRSLMAYKGHTAMLIYPYFFAGLGIFYFNPQAKYHGVWYNLQPLGTEGEGLVPTRPKYKRVQLSIPFGFGLKFPFYHRYLLGIEYGIRKTFTDYIDDVSTTYYDPKLLAQARGTLAAILSNRSDPNNPEAPADQKAHPSWTAPNQERGDSRYNDAYMFLNISLIYKLRNTRRGIPRF